MAVETRAPVSGAQVSAEAHAALISEKPVLITRMYLQLFQALAARNPFLASPLARIKRRLLALNRLEFRALVTSFWKDEHQQTMAAVMSTREKWLADPTGLIESLDGRLTWIEGASTDQLIEEAAGVPRMYCKVEEIFDLAARKLPAIGGQLHDVEHELITATFEVMACHSPALTDRLMAIKTRILVMAPNRRLALRAAMWQEFKHLTVEQVMSQYQEIFHDPTARLPEVERKLEAAEALSCEEIDEQLKTLPAMVTSMRSMFEGQAMATP